MGCGKKGVRQPLNANFTQGKSSRVSDCTANLLQEISTSPVRSKPNEVPTTAIVAVSTTVLTNSNEKNRQWPTVAQT